jgi:hypothetical protein
MKPITFLKQLVAIELEQLALLIRTYRTVAQRSPLWHQIVWDLTQRVLDSDEINNAMSYAVEMKAEDLLTQAVEQSEELLRLKNSPMTGLEASKRASYSVLKENVFRTLVEHARASQQTSDAPQMSPPVSGSYGNFISLGDISEAFANLNRPLSAALLLFVAVVLLLFLIVNIAVAATLGSIFVLLIDLILILSGSALFFLAVQSSARWTLPEKDADNLMRTEIAPFVRERVNAELRRAKLQDTFHITIAPALTELSDREQVVETATMRRLRMSLNTMAYGSIGISGLRGTGKSVLLRAFCDERFGQPDVPELGILFSAPVDYDGRDFIIHLFSTLCLRVVNLARAPGRMSRLRPFIVNLYQIGAIIGVCLIGAERGVKLSHKQIGFSERILLALIVMLVFLALLSRFTGVRFTGARFITTRQPESGAAIDPVTGAAVKDRDAAVLITVTALVIMLIGVLAFLNTNIFISPHSAVSVFSRMKKYWPSIVVLVAVISVAIANQAIPRMRDRKRPRNIADRASDYLRRLELIRTVTKGHSAAMIGFAGRIQFNRNYANQLTERDLTLPAIVELYRDFASDAAVWWRARHGGQGRIVIGIDELDKIANTESAERFLNEIKAVFGTPGCLYIVSVSEEASLQFERGSFGFRSSLDNAFDDIFTTDILSPSGTRDLLLSRLAGIGDPFIVLCHVLSGGVSRDALRTARAIVEARCNGFVNLKEITGFLVSREINDLKKGLLSAYGGKAIADHRQPLEGGLVEALHNDQWPGTDSQTLLSAATSSLKSKSPELHSALCFFATIYDIAVNESSVPWGGFFVPGIVADAAQDLAGAHSWLSNDPDAALELVRAARGKLRFRPIE